MRDGLNGHVDIASNPASATVGLFGGAGSGPDGKECPHASVEQVEAQGCAATLGLVPVI
jgi:hypothetical protein